MNREQAERIHGLQVPFEPRNKGKKEPHAFLGLMLAIAAVIIICSVIVLGVGIFANEINYFMGKL